MRVHKTDDMRLPLKMWLEDIDQNALEQAENLANLPFTFRYPVAMADAHLGYGMIIGGVLATTDVIIPNAVGADVGCGMCAIKTPWKYKGIKDYLPAIKNDIERSVPVGKNKHKVPVDRSLMPITYQVFSDEGGESFMESICEKEYQNARLQIGTLGGGNHFIEIQKDKEDNVWIMLHSGSRNLGYKVAKHYNRVAKELNKKWCSSVDPKWDLAFLPIDSIEAKNYIQEMNYCVDYALANRKKMMRVITEIFNVTVDDKQTVDMSDMINIAHNYARLENHFGKNVWVHRKGATSAKEGEIGIIPGSQGTKSYIVRGKGNKESFMSCSHGAGRTMGRKEAIRKLNLEEEQKKLEDQGILHSLTSEKKLDESISAYKDISVVMENQKDLVDIVEELTSLAVIKG